MKFKKSSHLTFLSGTNFGLHRSLLAQIDRALLEEVAWPTVGLGSGGLLFVDLVLKWFIEVSLSLLRSWVWSWPIFLRAFSALSHDKLKCLLVAITFTFTLIQHITLRISKP